MREVIKIFFWKIPRSWNSFLQIISFLWFRISHILFFIGLSTQNQTYVHKFWDRSHEIESFCHPYTPTPTDVAETLVDVLNVESTKKDDKTRTQVCFRVSRPEPENLGKFFEKEVLIGAIQRNEDKVSFFSLKIKISYKLSPKGWKKVSSDMFSSVQKFRCVNVGWSFVPQLSS